MINLDQIAQRLRIAELAISHQNAKTETRHAKEKYYSAWRRFETGDDSESGDYSRYVHQEERIGRHHPQFDEACAATQTNHDTYKAKKREEYNAQRRLENAIRSAA